ncbi:hypothetical protein [Pseudorhodoferax sp.]|uniref:hypothetical protein n=1 Tax=Pseudorhodoferax sp. TaxID=1993553 RepID=UPI0039E3ACF0
MGMAWRRRARHAAAACLALLCAGALAAPAAAGPAARVGLLDARQPGAAHLAWNAAEAPAGARLRYLPLSPPGACKPLCCVQAVEPTDTQIQRVGAREDRPLRGWTARLSARAAPPLVGLVFTRTPRVDYVNAQRVLLRWPGDSRPVRVDHCLSQEGLHVRLAERGPSGRWREAAHYYLPLGMEVEANCPATAQGR